MSSNPAVLIIGQSHGDDITFWALPIKLAEQYGINVGGMLLKNLLSLDDLRPFNAVVICDLSRLNPNTTGVQDELSISPDRLNNLIGILTAYVNLGGGLYVYGHSYSAAGERSMNSTLNEFTKTLGAELIFEELRDPVNELQQETGMKVCYALAHSIEPHPATSGVERFLYPIGLRHNSGYGPWTLPLKLDDGSWTPLIRTSESFVSKTLSDETVPKPVAGLSEVPGASAVIYAARELDNGGRIIINGSESVISFFNYDYSTYANEQWGTVGMENGLNGYPSHGLNLLVSSLLWLVEPSMGEKGSVSGLGGFEPPSPPLPKPAEAVPPWKPPNDPLPSTKYLKGVIGAVPALGGGSGQVSEWADAAKQQGLDFVVFAGDFEIMSEAAWEQLKQECAAATSVGGSALDFRAIPALLTRDEVDNRFITTGPPLWPQAQWLSTADPLRVRKHTDFWFASQTAFRAPYKITQGTYPSWLYSAYGAFPVRTYENNVLSEDQFTEFLQNQEQGDGSIIFVMTLVNDPALLAGVPEYTYVHPQYINCFNVPYSYGALISFVSDGPLIEHFGSPSAFRDTKGALYHPGSERWRLYLRASAPAGLKEITLRDGTKVIRRFAVSGVTQELNVDLLHDRRQVLSFVVEDVNGRKAATGCIESNDDLMRQYFLSDRCNMTTGLLTTFESEGARLKRVAATSILYKGGRLHFNAPISLDEVLPGVDGSGLSHNFSHSVRFHASPATGYNGGNPVHQINRPYESADAIIHDTPILKRTDEPEAYGHGPYVPLQEPLLKARLTQYYFYRRPPSPSAALTRLSLTFPDLTFPPPAPGWNGFTQIYTQYAHKNFFNQYLIVLSNNTVQTGAPINASQTLWSGTLRPGDSVLFPEVREGFFVLSGNLAVLINEGPDPSDPGQTFFRLWTGKFDRDTNPVDLLTVKLSQGTDEAETLQAWVGLRDQYGMSGQPPAYELAVTQGAVASRRYLVEIRTDQYAFDAVISSGVELPMRLPLRIRGLNPRWTAGLVDTQNGRWFPLGVHEGTAYTTVDVNEAPHVHIGNLVTADDAQVSLTLLPHNVGGKTAVDIHNPTDQDRWVTVTVPTSTFLAAQQTSAPVWVPKGSTIRYELSGP